MSDDKNKISEKNIIDHDYDGIQECDNDMPDWWLWSFFLCVMFAGLYFLHYASGSGPTLRVEFDQAWAHHMDRYRSRDTAPVFTDEDLLQKFSGAGITELGAKVYQRSCQACHGDQLQGVVGPNLVDHFWIHGEGHPTQIFATVKAGISDKGMPAWGEVLSSDDLLAVVAFVHSKRGAKVDVPKAPQGVPYPEYIKQ